MSHHSGSVRICWTKITKFNGLKGVFLFVLVWVSFLHSDCGLDALGLVTPFVFFLDILPCSTICSRCAKILSQFTAPCDALRTWPFCFHTCWSHFINGVLFLRISAPDLDLSLPRDWFGRVCQVPAALQVPSSRQCGAIPAPESLRMRFILRSGWERMLRLWRLIIHFLAPSTFFLAVYSVGGLVSCMLWYPLSLPGVMVNQRKGSKKKPDWYWNKT